MLLFSCCSSSRDFISLSILSTPATTPILTTFSRIFILDLVDFELLNQRCRSGSEGPVNNWPPGSGSLKQRFEEISEKSFTFHNY
jgi:hypothetical protein